MFAELRKKKIESTEPSLLLGFTTSWVSCPEVGMCFQRKGSYCHQGKESSGEKEPLTCSVQFFHHPSLGCRQMLQSIGWK
jgi:hypothetical protein